VPSDSVIETGDQPEVTEDQESLEAAEEVKEEQTSILEESASEQKRRQTIRADLRPLWQLAATAEFNNAQILKFVEKRLQFLETDRARTAEVLKYFELAQEIFSDQFPPDRKKELVCSFAEIILEGHLDAETLAALVSEVVPAGEAAEGQEEKDGYEGVAFFQKADGAGGTRVMLLEKFFQQNENGDQIYNLAHMLKHEIGHGLVRYGELLTADEIGSIVGKARNPEQKQQMPKVSAEIRKILDQARTDQNFQTFHLTTVLKSLHELRNRQGVTEAQIQQREIMAANQIMAEKTGIFLSSNGEFDDFLRANIDVTSDENLNNIFGTIDKPEIQAIIDKITTTDGEKQAEQLRELRHECPGLSRFLESNKVFFDLASERLQDKAHLKEKIHQNIQNDTEISIDEEDFFGYYDTGFYEPATAASGGSERSKEQRSSWISLTLELADAFGEEVKQVTPITELSKDR
jgi:hypothetical protein